MIESRFYRIKGVKWEARFFKKNEVLPETDLHVPAQGVWARPAESGWERALYVGGSWQSVNFELDVRFMPERK